MNRNLRIALAAMLGIVGCCGWLLLEPAGATVNARQETRADTKNGNGDSYRLALDTVWQLVKDHFHDPAMNGIDWQRVGDQYRSKLAEVKTRADFEALVNRMLSELHASHAAYVTDDDVEFYMLPAVLHQDLNGYKTEHIGIMGSQDRNQFVVAGVLDGGPADVAGIQSGDRLLSADGAPFRSAGSFRGKEGKAVLIQLKRGGEPSPRTVTVTPVKQNILRAYLEATEKSAKVLSLAGHRIGYVHLWTMANEAFHTALDRLVERKLHDTDGLILDLRDGYGGSPWNYADVFYRPDVSWQQRSRNYGAVTRHSGYGKPMVVLINQGTRSAKEFLSYEFKTSHRARLVGTRTAGAFLGAGGFDVGKDGLLELPILGLKVDGKLLEDNGVVPDIVVTPKSSYTDRDSQLLAGQRALLDAIGQAPASRPAL